jgi:hypothetical protein
VKSPRRPVAWCLEPHDLVLAKCVAGRQRDWEFARDALAARIVEITVLLSRVSALPIGDDHQRHVYRLLETIEQR